jgi:hypothetical protein
MTRLTIFLKDDATVVGDISTNTAGASGDTSQTTNKKKKKSNLMSRLIAENVIKFSISHENGVERLNKLQDKYPDAVFTYSLTHDITGDVSGNGVIEVSDVWYNDIKAIIKDYKWLDLSD